MLILEKESLSTITTKLQKALGDNLILVVAFGSRVRGDFHGESDFDLLVVVDRKNYNLLREIVDILYEEEEKTGIPYSIILRDRKSFEMEKRFKTGFFMNLLQEGKVLYGKINS